MPFQFYFLLAEADRLLFEDPHPTQGFMLHLDLE